MFGVSFDGHPCLRRILIPSMERPPLRRTPGPCYRDGALQLRPSAGRGGSLAVPPGGVGLQRYANTLHVPQYGPHHPSTHGVLRSSCARRRGDNRLVPDIGYTTAGREDGRRSRGTRTIPYTDRSITRPAVDEQPAVRECRRAPCESTCPTGPRSSHHAQRFLFFSPGPGHHQPLVSTVRSAQDWGRCRPCSTMFTSRERR